MKALGSSIQEHLRSPAVWRGADLKVSRFQNNLIGLVRLRYGCSLDGSRQVQQAPDIDQLLQVEDDD